MDTKSHPVWTVYDRLRSARLNVKYYECRLQAIERVNFEIEMSLLASAPSSAIAGLWFWQTEDGKYVWQCMGVLAAIASIAKPLLGLTKKIKDYETVLSGYRTLEHDLAEIKGSIEQKQKYDPALQAEFKKVAEREKVLVAKNPETRESKRIKKRCEEEVRRELPVDGFYIPV